MPILQTTARFSGAAIFSAFCLARVVNAATPAPASPQVLPRVDVVASPIVAESIVDPFAFGTTTVGAEQIEALNAQDLASALRRTPGVSIARYNTIGAFGGAEGGAVFLRGLGSSRPGGEIKTTFDGVPVGNGVFNHPLLDLLPLDLAGSIEVSRRAQPLAQGNMFAGVNVTAPRVVNEGAFGRAAVSAGSFGTIGEKVEAGGRFGATEIYAGESYRRSDGHRPDADGRLGNALVRVGWKPVSGLELGYLVHRSDNRATDPGPVAGAGLPPTRGDRFLTDGWLQLATAQWARASGEGGVRLYHNAGHANWFRRTTSANPDSLSRYRLTGARWRETERPWESGELVGGVDLDWTKGETFSVPPGAARTLAFGPEQFRLLSAYTGVRQTWNAAEGITVTPSAGARYYRHQFFGTAWSPQVGLVVQKGPWQGHASFSRAINFPGLEVAAFSTVAIPALGQSWRALGPERLEQWEVGVAYDLTGKARIDATLFVNDGRNRFVFVPPPPPPFRFVNVESFRTRGGEVTLTLRPGQTVSLFAGLSYLEPQPADLPYAPRWSLVGGATWRPVRAVTVSVDSSYVSSQRSGAQARAANAINTERVAAFAVVNARVAYRLPFEHRSRHSELFLAVENMLDRNYRYRPGYPMPGIGYTVGASVGF